MQDGSPWVVLGVQPDADEAAVRAAYAIRLKQTNPEDDAEAFKQLRLAYERVLRIARRSAGLAPDDQRIDGDYHDETRALTSASHSTALRDEASRKPEEESHAVLRSRLSEALQRNEEPEVLKKHLHAVLRANAMDRLDTFADTQIWLVDLVHEMRPQSYPLIDPIIAHFAWKVGPEILDEWPGPRMMFELREDFRSETRTRNVINRFEDPRHEFHRAYVLVKPSASPVQTRTRLEKLWALRHLHLMERFFVNVERRHRGVLPHLDQTSIEWWRRQMSNDSMPFTIVRNARPIAMGIAVIIALYVAGHGGGAL